MYAVLRAISEAYRDGVKYLYHMHANEIPCTSTMQAFKIRWRHLAASLPVERLI